MVPTLMKLLEKLEIDEWYCFNPKFIFSLIFGSLFVCIFQILNSGLNIYYAFRPYNGIGQIHASTIIWLTLIFATFYIRHDQEKPFRRFLVAFCFLVFIWEVHEVLWLSTALWKGNELITPERAANTLFNTELMSRNVSLLLLSAYYLRKNIRITKYFIVLISFQIIYWLNINFTQVFYHFFIILVVDTLPYLRIDKTGRWL